MKKRWVLVLMTMAAMVFGLTAGALAEQGVTDTEIHIGQWGPQTGPAAPWGAVARGTGVFFKMINEKGGIHGRDVEQRQRRVDLPDRRSARTAGLRSGQRPVGARHDHQALAGDDQLS